MIKLIGEPVYERQRNGGLKFSGLFTGGHWGTYMYYGYTVKEARQLFKQWAKTAFEQK